ncbi:MAG: glycosyltransferase [Deinococcus-Thermus bacterium]|jgi:glycosyltransferase involved in cell wall biosynthesis|nr:glycosyltransferase [Deinococcota bacterium]
MCQAVILLFGNLLNKYTSWRFECSQRERDLGFFLLADRKSYRILVLVQNLSLPFDRRVWNEATTLRANGYDIVGISPNSAATPRWYEVVDGIEIFRYPHYEASIPVLFIIEYAWTLFCTTIIAWWIFATRGFRVIHACNPPDLFFLVAAPFRLVFGTKFVFDHHDLCPELFQAKFGNLPPLNRVHVLLERATFALADVSIATNESYRHVAVTRGRMKPEKVFVVRSGPDLDRFRIPKLDEGERRALRGDAAHVVGYVGVMGRQEGLSYLLAAARVLVRDRGHAALRFWLVGDGPDLPRLRAEARDLGVADQVVFHGCVSDDVLLNLLFSCDVCVNPDEYNAFNNLSTMNKIIEYMALKRPIVQFDLEEGRVSAGAASAFARPNDAVSMADEIEALLADADRRARMGEIGYRRVVDLLAWQHQVPHLLAAYEAVTARPATSAALQRPGGEA